MEELERENAELESLVRSMLAAWKKFHGYHGNDVPSKPEREFIAAFERDMAELGIETGGGA